MPQLSEIKADATALKQERKRRTAAATQAIFPERTVKLARRVLASPVATKAAYDTPERIKKVLRQAVHIVAMVDDPEYRRWFQQAEEDAKLPAQIKRVAQANAALGAQQCDPRGPARHAALREEEKTRQADRLASDPEFAARVASRKHFRHEQRQADQYNNAMIRMKGELPRRRQPRLREIWAAVIECDRRATLPVAERIKATPRIRGAGAAAKRAGF